MIEFFTTSLRLLRSMASAWRRDPEFRSLMFLAVITLLGVTIFYSSVEGWSVVDALYFSVTTLTTVGLGDLSPETTLGKIFTVICIFAGLSIILGFIDAVSKETLGRRRRRHSRGVGQHDENVSGSYGPVPASALAVRSRVRTVPVFYLALLRGLRSAARCSTGSPFLR
jgi:voltage-gated potassium channel